MRGKSGTRLILFPGRGSWPRLLIGMAAVLYIVTASVLFFVQQIGASQDSEKILSSGSEMEMQGKGPLFHDRLSLRAFYSAPPVIPHVLEQEGSKDCLRCHGQLTVLDEGRTALPPPHPHFFNCLQCHLPVGENAEVKVESNWKGLEEPERGTRWFPLSPPTIPHRTFMRNNCLACHGPASPDMRLRTPHPERSQCLQCHLPQQSSEF